MRWQGYTAKERRELRTLDEHAHRSTTPRPRLVRPEAPKPPAVESPVFSLDIPQFRANQSSDYFATLRQFKALLT